MTMWMVAGQCTGATNSYFRDRTEAETVATASGSDPQGALHYSHCPATLARCGTNTSQHHTPRTANPRPKNPRVRPHSPGPGATRSLTRKGTDLMNTTALNHEEHVPNVNSEAGRAITRVLYVLGFPHHRIGSLFDADHGYVSQVTDLMDATTRINRRQSTPHLNSETGRAIVRMLYMLGFPRQRIGFLFDADHGDVAQVTDLRDATCVNREGGIPDPNSETERAIIRVLYLLGFPVHGIEFLFNAHHGHGIASAEPRMSLAF
jgi:hypothetical protein